MPLPANKSDKEFLPWLIRHVTVVRGELTFNMECAPAFNYAQNSHETKIDKSGLKADFTCPEHLNLDLRCVPTAGEFAPKSAKSPSVVFDLLDLSDRGHKGLGVTSKFTLKEGESVTFVLREPPKPETSAGGKEAASESGDWISIEEISLESTLDGLLTFVLPLA